MKQPDKSDMRCQVCEYKAESHTASGILWQCRGECETAAGDPVDTAKHAPGVYEAVARLLPPVFRGDELERLSILDYRDRFVKRYGEPSCFEDCLLIIQAYAREAMVYMQETYGPDAIGRQSFQDILSRKAGRAARLGNLYKDAGKPANVKSASDAWLDDAIYSDIALMLMADLWGRPIGWYPVTSIYWTNQLNPVTGCTKTSEACRYCFAKANHDQIHRPGKVEGSGDPAKPTIPRLYRNPFNQVTLQAEQLEEEFAMLARISVPQVVFVGNLGDLFHRDVPFPYIARVFDGMASLYLDRNPGHTFLLLTKRAPRMKDFMEWYLTTDAGKLFARSAWPHIWLGVTAENQRRADERIPVLLSTLAAHRWISAEPLLGPIDLEKFYGSDTLLDAHSGIRQGQHGLDLVIAGGESGKYVRETKAEWFKSLYDQCKLHNTRFYLTQMGDAFKGQLPASYIGLDAYKMPFERAITP